MGRSASAAAATSTGTASDSAATPRGRRLARDQAGITLVEMLVAIALTAIVSTLMVSIVVTVSRTFTRESQASTNSAAASVGMRELSRVVRSAAEVSLAGFPTGAAPADAFLSAGPHQLRLYSFVEGDVAAPAPLTVQFAVAGDGTLSETRWAGSPAVASGATPASSASTTVWQFAATPASTRPILRGVVSTTAAPLFRYYSAAGVELLPNSAGELTSAQLATIASVRVALRVQQSPTSTAAAGELENTIGLPNLGITRSGIAP
jgi:Tfp pilus assembly protein PilW